MIKMNTKDILLKAFLELSKEKSAEKITIRDILDRSGVAKQTFYNHFKDKYDLMNYVYKRTVENIFAEYDVTNDFYNCILQTYQFLQCNKNYYTNIIRIKGQNDFKQFLFQNTKDFYLSRLQQKLPQKELTDRLKFIVDFNCHGATNMCLDWIVSGMKASAEEMAELIIDCLHPDIRQHVLGR